MQTVGELSKRFGIKDEVRFENLAEGYPALRVKNQHAEATIALHGAHLTHYCVSGDEPVIFTSQSAIFREGKAIRGGIPICWPWFGAQPNQQTAHGYARTHFWDLQRSESNEEGTRLVFSLPPQDDSGLVAMIEFHIGKDLQLALHTMNTGCKETTFSEALHSYFSVVDSQQTKIHGLEGARYVNTADETTRHTQEGPVTFPGEIDRIYHSDSECIIEDGVSHRKIRISKAGSASTVVWNPGLEKGTAMADLADEQIHAFVCCESANVRGQSVTLAPGENHILHLKISTES